MSIKIGGINLAESIINLEYQLDRTQRILDWVVQQNKLQTPSLADVEKIDEEALAKLVKKYPDAGISAKNN